MNQQSHQRGVVVWCGVVWCSAVRYRAVRCDVVRCGVQSAWLPPPQACRKFDEREHATYDSDGNVGPSPPFLHPGYIYIMD